MKKGVTQLHLGDAQKGLCVVGCYLYVTPSELSERGGIKIKNSGADFEYMEAAIIQDPNGKRFGLMCDFHSPRQDYTAMFINEKTTNVTAYVNDGLEALGIDSREINSFHPDYKFQLHAVWRQDDHGNRFLVGEFLCRPDATNAMDRLASGQHKQSYWVEKAIR